MRFAVACGAFAVLISAASAQTPAPNPGVAAGTPPVVQAPARGAPPRSATPAKPDSLAKSKAINDQAQREAAEREKRWDDRMRRVTRSMCDRC